MKRYLIVFEEEGSRERSLTNDLKAFVDSLDDGAQMYAFDGRVGFLKTRLNAQEVTNRLLKFAGSDLFFVADITSSDCSGRMYGFFWDFLKKSALANAAE
jgi:hypothetical protein